MAGRAGSSLRSELFWNVVAVTAFVAVSAIALHAYVPPPTAQPLPRRQAMAIAELVAAGAGEVAATGDKAHLEAWAQRVTRTRMVLGLTVIGADGEVAVLAADRGELTPLLLQVAEQTGLAKMVFRADLPGVPSKGRPASAWLVTAPLGAGRSQAGGYVGVLVGVGADQPPPWWLFPVAMAGIAVAMVAVTVWWLVRCVENPIATLARACVTGDFASVPPGLSQRGDAMGRLARAVESTDRKLKECEARAEHLEQTVDRRVAARTRQISLALRRAEQHAWQDPLTGVVNRRFIDRRLPEIFDAQRQAGQDLTLAMLDLDHFKRFNDTFGHQAGDELLRFVGSLLRHAVRETDIAARYGGDEFLLILPAASLEQGGQIAERVTVLFAQQAKILPAPGHPMAVSAGLASLEAHKPADLPELIRLADDALYEAKRTGRRSLTAPLPVSTAG
ncbi:MAG TPA: GGDEF domain-containing protein [Phycisphaerae bacterium]|nr:GGDEF domain-containing protein [Phycisphaerae bacterium]